MINPNIPPPNGFIFTDIDGTAIRGTSWSNLEKKVVAYRKQTDGVMETVKDEIRQQVCNTTPSYCNDPGSPEDNEMTEEIKSQLFRYLLMMVAAKRDGHLRYCPQEETHQRTNICARCPHRTTISTGCKTCGGSIAAVQRQAIGDQSHAPLLGFCTMAKCDLPTAIHCCENPDDNPRLPDYCWRKKK